MGIGTIWQMELPNDCSANESVDDATVRAAAAGDRSALQAIYEVTSDRVFRLMVRMVGLQDADDLTQQTFVRAFTKLDQFSSDSKFETWLYRLATNEALQHLRREKHRRTKELMVEPAIEATDQVEQDERVAMVRQALDQLDPELWAIFTLKEESGLSYQEIAQTLNIPEGTVGSRLNRARRELRTLLAKLT
ncbi:ECF RNA polymerase sigma factor SigE [Stieleria magnilauensis]|uniref:ECF RNA polymerase sigma factor SigE n=2 Tax=Stieleria magnilauensis TaxID=2527963 RepID=A0ABX5XUZ2_9BACT|nr:ECF RNA polymerase sigma factor SigE [Planctomycetes bacterium TBK1r]